MSDWEREIAKLALQIFLFSVIFSVVVVLFVVFAIRP